MRTTTAAESEAARLAALGQWMQEAVFAYESEPPPPIDLAQRFADRAARSNTQTEPVRTAAGTVDEDSAPDPIDLGAYLRQKRGTR